MEKRTMEFWRGENIVSPHIHWIKINSFGLLVGGKITIAVGQGFIFHLLKFNVKSNPSPRDSFIHLWWIHADWNVKGKGEENETVDENEECSGPFCAFLIRTNKNRGKWSSRFCCDGQMGFKKKGREWATSRITVQNNV